MRVVIIDRRIGDSGRGGVGNGSAYTWVMPIEEAARFVGITVDDMLRGFERRNKYVTEKFWIEPVRS